MLEIEEVEQEGYEKVFVAYNTSTNTKINLAIYSTKLGPALVGLRLQLFMLNKQAIDIALEGAKKCAYKSAVAGLQNGGGYCVVNAAHMSNTIYEDLVTLFNYANDTGVSCVLATADVNCTLDVLKEVAVESAYVNTKDTTQYQSKTIIDCIEAYRRFSNQETVTVNVDGINETAIKVIEAAKERDWDVCVSDLDYDYGMAIAGRYSTAFSDNADIQYLSGVYVPCASRTRLKPTVLAVTEFSAVIGSNLFLLDDEEVVKAMYDNDLYYIPSIISGSGDFIAAAGASKELLDFSGKQAASLLLAGTLNKQNILTLTNELAEKIIQGENNG